ncbi:MAG: acetate--CoA ligase family protein [Thermoplasmata archaeon]|nr:acetate--CoA ligase family protein [Thermoplasmata archaeon]
MTVGRSETLAELFEPKSIAVIGASNRPDSVGFSLFRNILTSGFRGVVYPVNPGWKSVSGVRCYPSVEELPETPELGVIIVPAPKVSPVADALGRRGTRGVVVISAGFKEVGGSGIALEEELVRTVRKHRMSLIGPNCFGILNTDPAVGLNATFSDSLPARGNIGFVSQSGALCAGILRYGAAERIGFSRFLSVGNRAGVDENDLIHSLGADPATQVILLYIESLADGRRFLETAREVTELKPVLVIKSGRSAIGERAARSHTGSLANAAQDRLFDALFEQSGVLRAESIGELFRMAKIFSSGLRLEGPRLAILTNSGGPGIVAADACARHGLELPTLPPVTRESLAGFLSPSSALGNPVDMTADARPEQYRRALELLLANPEVNAALVIATPTGIMTGRAVSEAILAARGSSGKPVTACLFGLTDLSHDVSFLEEHGIPTFTFPEEAISGLGSLSKYHAWRTRPRTEVRRFPVDRAAVRRTIREATAAGLSVLPEYAARRLLHAYGIPTAGAERVRTVVEAGKAAGRIGYPVALKVASPDISHKTDVGGVALGIETPFRLRLAWDAMARALAEKAPAARIEGFEIEAMVPSGKEVLIGVQRDPGFGPIVVFGMGGIYVEVLRDVTFRLAPLRPLSARHMVESVRTFDLLKGVRGEPPSDLEALYEVLERVSQLAVEVPEVSELDINPLIVRASGKGAVAVDARVVLTPTSRSGSPVSIGRSSSARRGTPARGAARPRRR